MSMIAESYDVNQKVRVVGRFESTGSLYDPSSEVTLKVLDPSSNATTHIYNGGAGTVTKEATGIYYVDVILDEAGTWYYRWEGTSAGALDCAFEGNIVVNTTQF